MNVKVQGVKNTIKTFSGVYFDYEEMNPNTILIEDIAHPLSLIPRWAGHSQICYSVAQHCCWCHDTIFDHTGDSELAFEALMHDSPEAYLGDCPKPLKNLLPDYQKIEDKLSQIIAKKFGFKYPHSAEVKRIDREALLFELDNVKLFSTTEHWNPLRAEQEFLNRFHKYVALNVTQKQK